MNAAFSTRTLIVLILTGAVAFGGALLFSVFGDDLRRRAGAGANSYSESAIGHSVFVNALEDAGYTVFVSHRATAQRASVNSLLILAEPGRKMERPAFRDLILRSPYVLLVLPKRWGRTDPSNKNWIGKDGLLPEALVQSVLDMLPVNAKVVRPEEDVAWQAPTFTERPTVREPQLIRSSEIRPMITRGGDILLGGITGHGNVIWVLSDPDLIANHGIGKGENAAIIQRVLDRLTPKNGTIILDETTHGLTQSRSFWRRVLEIPYIVVPFHAAIAAIVLLLAATRRFGAPARLADEHARGQRSLIESAVDLIVFGGHQGEALKRYLADSRREVLDGYRISSDAGDTHRWFARMETQKDAPHQLRDLEARVSSAAAPKAGDRPLVRTAQRIHDWKQGMLHGTRSD